ncbi:O-antigen polymerase [Desulfosporosinus shakirovi]|uniref:O-antigen polymerase n=1 Tax=Desulfosporosinus shakirovi TaxID=2885154 RepID=UPI001E45EF36|nr:O-antigen polymerase [Desulfosporosinus sp. SRJS8]MCB8817598.1 oligosaccharide repeat unit polymerase [Desulfosporosinus sp. SRJS8]
MTIKKKNLAYIITSIFTLLLYSIYNFYGNITMSNTYGLTMYYWVILGSTLFLFYKTKFNFINPAVIFACAYIVFIALGPIILVPLSYEYNFNYLLVTSSAYACFIGGYSMAPNCFFNKIKYAHLYLPVMKKKDILLILIGISFLIWLIYLRENIGVLLSDDFESNRISSQQGNGAYLYLIRMLMITIPMLYEELHQKMKVKYWFWALTLISSIILLTLGGRSPIFIIIIQMVIYRIIAEKVQPELIIKYGIIVLISTAILGMLRTGLSDDENITTITNALNSVFLNGNYNLSYIFGKFPSQIPFQHGYTYLINFEMLMPGPDLDFTLWIKEMLGMSFRGGGVTPTIIGELYINFNYAGIFIGMFIMGIVGKVLYLYLCKSKLKSYPVYLSVVFALSVSGGIANYSIPVLLYSCLYCYVNIFGKR